MPPSVVTAADMRDEDMIMCYWCSSEHVIGQAAGVALCRDCLNDYYEEQERDLR